MDRKDRLEGEEIQKGLEQFLERELYGSAGVYSGKEKESEPKEPDELDLSLAQPPAGRTVSRAPEKKTVEKKPAEKKQTENRSGARRSPDRTTESVYREMGNQKTESKKTGSKKTGSSGADRKRPDQSRKNVKEESKKTKKQEKKKKKKNKLLKVLVVIAALFVICFIGLYSLVGSVYNKMAYQEAESFTAESMKEDGVINILLIGNDSRLAGDDGRSDAMILVSVSDKTKTITMTSLLRDMYVEIPGHDGNRLNAAYSYGGPELLMQTIEQNFDIPVHRYALVNFQAFANLVDAVGGVDLELTNEEVQYVNGYLMEYNQLEGKDLATDFLDPSLSGNIHLNGPQALAYTRNRYIGTDFGRTERQRKVLSAVIGKLPGALLTNGGELTNGLFPNLTTNLQQGECFSLALNAWKFLGYEMVQQCVPVEGSYSNATIRSMAVLEVDFETNKRFLKTTLYGE